jgi:mannose-6-phosphate isomerase
MIFPLTNPVRPYAWGSRTVLPELLGEPSPAPEPRAELWMGAHSTGPSRLPNGEPLDKRIAADPVGELGEHTVAELGTTLPFLAKLLAAEAPLSLQAHPTTELARAGYAAEEAAGIPPDDPRRNYPDPQHKPELICAVTPFTGLIGFRDVAETRRLLAELAVPELAAYDAVLAERPDEAGLRQVVGGLLALDPPERGPLVAAVGAACGAGGGEFAPEKARVADLAAAYPDDAGVVVALLMNLVRLAPGQAVFLPAGNLHAYLDGFGVEVLVNSDNVLRGGLTGKHVDVPELLRVLDPVPGLPPVQSGRALPNGEHVYDVPAKEFRLSRITVADDAVTVDAAGPQIFVALSGTVRVEQDAESVGLAPGRSAYLPAGGGPVTVTGSGTAYRVTTNLEAPGTP